jgi:hypothetical protein
MKLTLPHWVSLGVVAAGGAAEALASSFPTYAALLKVAGGVLITLGTTGVLSLPAAGPFARKGNP